MNRRKSMACPWKQRLAAVVLALPPLVHAATGSMEAGKAAEHRPAGPSSSSTPETAAVVTAAERGDPEAQVKLAGMYATGVGVAKDRRQAVAWYRKAAERGNASAQNTLGLLYAHGTVVPKDLPHAVAWYRKSAERGGFRFRRKQSLAL